MDGQIRQIDYGRLDTKAIAERLLAVTTLSSSDADLLVSDKAGLQKAVEILEAHERTRRRQDRISLNRERLRAAALG